MSISDQLARFEVNEDGLLIGYHNEGCEPFILGGGVRLDQRPLLANRPLFLHYAMDGQWVATRVYRVYFKVGTEEVWYTESFNDWHDLFNSSGDDTPGEGMTPTAKLTALAEKGFRFFLYRDLKGGEDEAILFPATESVVDIELVKGGLSTNAHVTNEIACLLRSHALASRPHQEAYLRLAREYLKDETLSKTDRADLEAYMSAAQAEYQKLRIQVAAAQQAYHTDDAPTMADGDYDELVRHVKAIEDAHPEWTLGQPVANVVGGATKRGLYPVKHKVPMLSLDNVFSVAELQDVMESWKCKPADLCDVSYKYDGLACSLTYLDQTLVEAATRGDRFEGESILHNIYGFDSVPKSLPRQAPDHIEVRGELLLFNDEFEAYNARLVALGKPPAVNPRNAAAGLARRLKQDKLPGAQLVFFPYSVIYHSGGQPQTFGESMAELAKWGFEMPYSPGTLKPYLEKDNPDDLLDFIDIQQEARKTLPFGIDGLVLRLEDYDKCDQLGYTSRAPRWAIAYKFPAEEKGTKVTAIRVQVGRTGNVTPVAEVEPVLVGGVTVTNATLHNEDHINALNIAIGDEVIIRRAGDVVPEIAKVLNRPSDRVEWTFPTHCDCGQELVRPEGQANHLCRNDECHHRVQRAFEHYVSRNAMDIEGLGEELIEKLLFHGKIRWYDDLYKLTEQDILDVTTATSKRYAESIIEAINKSRKTTMRRFIYALGIPMVGEGTAKRLHEFFGRFDILTGARPPLLLAVPDVGPGAAEAIDQYFDAAMWFYDFLDERPQPGRPPKQFPYGKIEFTDEQGPSPDFAKYHDPIELMRLAGIRGITAKKVDQVRDWCRRMGWPQNNATSLTPDEELAGAIEFFNANAEALSVVQKCWRLVDNNMEFVRKPAFNQPLVGKTYVLTGSFEETMGSRGELSKQLELLGAKVSGSVSAKTTAVFVGESPGANKINDAVKHAVPVLQAHDLQELLQQS